MTQKKASPTVIKGAPRIIKGDEKVPKATKTNRKTAKKSKNTKNDDGTNKISKARLIAYGICLVILVVLMVIAFTLMNKLREEQRPQAWIDCQPPLSEVEAERCEKARAENYPYIAY